MVTITEIQEKIQNLTNTKITQSDIADALGCGRANISLRAKNNSQLSFEEVKKIENKFNVSLDKQIINNPEELVEALYFPDVFGSCGNGTFELSQTCYKIQIPKNDFFKDINPLKKYSVINSYGLSMFPTFNDLDKLIVEHCSGNEQIQDNRIYVFCYNDKIFVKRLIYNVDEVIVKSDNPDKETYKTKFIQGEDINKLQLIGQVVGLARNLR